MMLCRRLRLVVGLAVVSVAFCGLVAVTAAEDATTTNATPSLVVPTKNKPVVVGQTFIAGSMDPTDGSTAWALTSHGISENLYTVNSQGAIVPQLAAVGSVPEKMNAAGTVWEVTLRADAKFSTGELVTPYHVAKALTDLNRLNSNAQSSLGNMTVTVVSGKDNTIRIESERPTHVMDAVLAEWVFVIYLNNSDDEDDDDTTNNFIYTGPYMVTKFGAEDDNSSNTIELAPNRHYDDRSFERPLITIQKYADGHALAKGLENNELDIGFHLPVDTLSGLREIAENVNIKSFEVGYHYMMFYNTDDDSTMSDITVRQAVDLVLDRTELSQALRGGTATRSLFPDYSPYYFDESEIQHGQDDRAGELLDQAGYTMNPDTGKRENTDGEELTVTLVAYPHRPGLVIMQPIIAKALTDIGMNVNTVLTGMDWDETQQIMDDRSFDILMWAQNTLPAGDPLWFLNAFFRSDGGNNHANFMDSNVDAALDELSFAEEHEERVRKSNAVHGMIVEQVPVSNLVTPNWHVGLSDRMADYSPYGSDYYIINGDLFTTDATMNAGTTAIEVVTIASTDEDEQKDADGNHDDTDDHDDGDDDDGDCHCDGEVAHCKDEAIEAAYTASTCAHDNHDDYDEADHAGDCHCDEEVAHCKDEADEAEYTASTCAAAAAAQDGRASAGTSNIIIASTFSSVFAAAVMFLASVVIGMVL